MQINKILLAGAFVAAFLPALGDTLTFVPQLDNGVTNYSWFNSGNWFSTDAGGNLISAGRLPLINDTAIITSMADAGASGLRVQTMIVTNNAVLTNGTYAVENLIMLSGSSFNQSTINVLVTMSVAETNCALNGSILTIFGTASGTVQPGATLTLAQGATLQDGGLLTLTDGSRITSMAPPQSEVVVGLGAVLNSTNSGALIGSSTNHLVIDNSGSIRADTGTLTFDGEIDWHSTAGAGEFRAASSNALLVFVTPFQVDAGVTDTFSGPGTNRWVAGGNVDGTNQVSGNLELLDSVTGAGEIEVLGLGTPGGVLTWSNGSLSLPTVLIDSGANLIMEGGAGSSRQLSGCTLNNSGVCEIRFGDLGLVGGAVINNSAGANFAIKADGIFSGTSGPLGGTFNNAGTFVKTSSGTTEFGTLLPPQGPDFNNSGLVDVQNGLLNLLGGISSGEFRTEPQGVLRFWGGTHTLNNGASFTGPGPVQLLEGVAPSTWLVNAGITVSNVEVGGNGTIDASGNTNLIVIGELLADSNGTLSDGNFAAQNLQMQDQAVLTNSSLSVASSLGISGTNCTLQASTLSLLSTASGSLAPPPSETNCSLNLNLGSVLQIAGVLNLNDGAVISGGAASPQNELVVSPGAMLVSSNQALVQGASANHLTIDNSGAIVSEIGVLQFGAGLDWKSSAGSAEFKASRPGSVLSFASPFHNEQGTKALFSGTGTNLWLSGGALAGEAQVSGNLQVLASVSGPGTIHVLGGATGGALTWANGTLSLSGINIDANGNLLINPGPGSGCQLSGCNVNNSGNCLWVKPGTVMAGAGASFNNLPGGTLDLQTDAVLTSNTPPILTLINAGVLLKSAGSGSSRLVADFNNDGSVEIQSGSLSFEGTWSQSLGSTIVDAGAVLGGTAFSVQGGTLQGLGTIAANVVNSGTVNPGTVPGVLTLGPGAGYQQTASGTLAVEIGGGLAGSQYDQLAVGGAASLAGRLQVTLINGFAPKPGDRFQVLTCLSQTGSFSSVDPSPIADTVWLPQYNGTNVTVILASAVSLSEPRLSNGVLTLPFSTAPGVSYTVQTSGTLSPPNWQTLYTVPGNGSVMTVSDSTTNAQRYYRVILQ